MTTGFIDVSALESIAFGTPLDALDESQFKALQRGLAICAYPVGLVDGRIGPKSRSAFAELIADLGVGDPMAVTTVEVQYLLERAARLDFILNEPGETTADVKRAIVAACRFIGLSMPEQIAYALATARWETNHTFKPVREAYWLSEEWRRNNLRYHPYYGRGYVQLTWDTNYRQYSGIFGIDLVADPDRALEHPVSLFVLAHGMKIGLFTGRALEHYVRPGHVDFFNARKVINGLDKASQIAELAEEFLDEL